MLWSPLLLSPILGAPELTVPSGEISYCSRISGKDEFLPVSVSVMGFPGTDLDLIDRVMKMMKHVGRPTKVHTGSRAFEN